MRMLAIISAAVLSGCTLAFGTVGGLTASSSNRVAREQGKPEPASVGARIMLGAALGLAVDALILRESLDGCCPDLSGLNR
jgi:hypothetical protein